jgi:hypothetical protein
MTNQSAPTPKHVHTAHIVAAPEFIEVTTYSGYRAYRSEPAAFERHFPSSVSDEDLGSAIRSAVAASRLIAQEEIKTFFAPRTMAQSYETWLATVLQRYAYRSRRSLFKVMRRCGVERNDAFAFALTPMRRYNAEGWEPVSSDLIVELPEAATDSELGLAARLALSRSQ